jgi:hypothetical protein
MRCASAGRSRRRSSGWGALPALAVAVVACVPGGTCADCGDEDTVAGTYSVSGTLAVHPGDGGPSESTSIERETVTVEVGRAYQYGHYKVAVRDCSLSGDGTLSSAGLQTYGPCTFVGPSGKFIAQPSGDVIGKGNEIELHLFGSILSDAGTASDGGTAGDFVYSVHGPKQ